MAKQPEEQPTQPDSEKGAKSNLPQDKAAARPMMRLGMSRYEREQRTRRIVIIGAAVVGALTILLISAAVLQRLVIEPNRAVASVSGQNITVSELQKRMRFDQALVENRYTELAQQVQQIQQQAAQGDESGSFLLQFYQQQLQQLAAQTSAQSIAQQALDDMITDKLVRQESAKRGLTINADDVEKSVEESQGFYRVPLTPFPTDTAEPTAPPTETAAPTNTSTATPQATATTAATRTAAPTVTFTPVPATSTSLATSTQSVITGTVSASSALSGTATIAPTRAATRAATATVASTGTTSSTATAGAPMSATVSATRAITATPAVTATRASTGTTSPTGAAGVAASSTVAATQAATVAPTQAATPTVTVTTASVTVTPAATGSPSPTSAISPTGALTSTDALTLAVAATPTVALPTLIPPTSTPRLQPTTITQGDYDVKRDRFVKSYDAIGFNEQDLRGLIESNLYTEKLREIIANEVVTQTPHYQFDYIRFNVITDAQTALTQLNSGAIQFDALISQTNAITLPAPIGFGAPAGDWSSATAVEQQFGNAVLAYLESGELNKPSSIITATDATYIVVPKAREVRALAENELQTAKQKAYMDWLDAAKADASVVKREIDPTTIIPQTVEDRATQFAQLTGQTQ